MTREFRFDSSQEIRSGIALVFVLTLSAAVAWIVVTAGNNIVTNFKESWTVQKGSSYNLNQTGNNERRLPQ